jgi:osmotically-inducible protein OsmY
LIPVKAAAGLAGLWSSPIQEDKTWYSFPILEDNMRPDSDPEIARDAVERLRDELPYSSQFIKVTVKDGRLTLEGALEWNYQRDRADEAVRSVRGVIDITDNLTLRPRVTVRDAKRQMRDAMRRSANSTRSALRSRLFAPK